MSRINVQSEAFRVVGERADAFEAALPPRIRFFGYPEKAVRNRLTQEYLFQFQPDISRDVGTALLSGNTSVPERRLPVWIPDGRIKIAPRMVARQLGRFIAYWIYYLLLILRAGFHAKRPEAATLLYGVGHEDLWGEHDESAEFIRFCRGSNIQPIREARLLCVQDANPVERYTDHLVFGRLPLLECLLHRKLTARRYFSLVFAHLWILPRFLLAVMRLPAVSFLHRDAAIHAICSTLNADAAIEDIIITNSNFRRQLLCFTDLPGRTFRLQMVWYSLNAANICWSEEELPWINPAYRHLRADTHWVWNEWQRDWLVSAGVAGSFAQSGAMVWRQPPVRFTGTADIDVLVFDITPKTEEKFHSAGLVGTYYDTGTMSLLLQTVVDACDACSRASGRPLRVALKPKRGYNRFSDPRYVELIQSFVQEADINCHFTVLKSTVDVWTAIDRSLSCIVTPFSSPAFMAAERGVPTAYLDPTGAIINIVPEEYGIRFLRGSAETEEFLRHSLDASKVPAYLYTPRFSLRPLEESDVGPTYHSWFQDAGTRQWIDAARSTKDLEELRQYVRDREKREDCLFLGIYSRQSLEHIGNIKFEPLDTGHRVATLGVLIGNPAWRGKGVFGEIYPACSHHLSQAFGIRRIRLGVETENVSARHAYEKSGFHCVDPEPGEATEILWMEHEIEADAKRNS